MPIQEARAETVTKPTPKARVLKTESLNTPYETRKNHSKPT